MTDYRFNVDKLNFDCITNCIECGSKLFRDDTADGPSKACGFHMRIFLDEWTEGVEVQ